MNTITTDTGNLTRDADELWKANAHLFFENGKRKKHFADLEDEHGRQVVDLVQEGGGVLGMALVGYTYILEKAGLRFASLAGTSAGSINSMMLSCISDEVYDAHFDGDSKSRRTAMKIANKPFRDFLDGNKMICRICCWIFSENKSIGMRIFLYAVFPFLIIGGIGAIVYGTYRAFTSLFADPGIIDERTDTMLTLTIGVMSVSLAIALVLFMIRFALGPRMGLFRGNAFSAWMKEEAMNEGVKDYGELKSKRLTPIKLYHLLTGEETTAIRKLVIMTSNITHRRITKFPAAASEYWPTPDTVGPNEFVRASMSIPFFFEVYQYHSAEGKVNFVDGGMLSNFPIREFHNYRVAVPRYPTFGVRIGLGDTGAKKTMTASGNIVMGKFLGSLISTFRKFYDDDYLRSNAETRMIVKHIDTRSAKGKDISSLGFEMGDDTKKYLFTQGAKAAIEFLSAFDWEEYKTLRQKLFADANP